MAGNTLTELTQMVCPHGGVVSFKSANALVKVQGAAVLLSTDVGTVAGCPFTLPGPKPSPCITVRWLAPTANRKSTIGGVPTVSQGTTGLCYSAEQAPQGPVVILQNQSGVNSM